MANPYYVEPMNIMPGLQMFGQGIQRRAGFERERVKAGQDQKIRDEAAQLFKTGTPEEIADYRIKHPEVSKDIEASYKFKSEQTRENKLDTLRRILIDREPPAQVLLERAEMVEKEGGEYRETLDDAKEAMVNEQGAYDKALKEYSMLASKDEWKQYQQGQGIGDDKKGKFEKGTPYVNEQGKRVVPIYDKNTKELVRTEELGKPQVKLDPVDQNKIMAIGDAIIRGEQPPKIGRELGKMAGPLRAYLAEKGFKQAEAMLDYNATKKHINTLNSVGQLRLAQATNFANHSLDLVVDLAEEWRGGGFAVLNKVNLAAARSGAYGEDAASLATRLSSQISDLQSELAVVYKGGNSPTDAGLEQASEQLKAEWSEKVLKDNVELIRKNLTIRQRSMKAIGVAGASESNPYAGKQADPHKKTPKYKEGQTANNGAAIFSNGAWRDNI